MVNKIDTLYYSIAGIFSLVVGGLAIRKLLHTAVKYNLITFNFATAEPIARISTVILIGLSVLGSMALIGLVCHAFYKK